MTNAISGEACRWNIAAASFLNGEALPRALTISATGAVVQDDSCPATTLDIDNVIVFPGLINSHDHLDFSLYPTLGDPPYSDIDEWGRDVHGRYASVVASLEQVPLSLRRNWGMLKNLMCGVTAVMDHSEPYDRDDLVVPIESIEPYRFTHRADARWPWLRARTRSGDGPLVFHVAEGSSEKVARRSARFLHRLVGHGPLIGIHGIRLNTELAQQLDALVWCPVSNEFLFNQTADIAALKEVTEILFGTDASISADGSIWDHLRVARAHGDLTDQELLDSVTSTASRVWGLKNAGDLVIARRCHSDPWESLFNTTAADICAVISQQQLVLMSEDFCQQVGLDSWQDSYQRIKVGNVQQRIQPLSSKMLDRLASIDTVPLALP